MLLPLHLNLGPFFSPIVQDADLVALAMSEILVESAMPERSVSLNVPELVVLLET